MIESIDRTAREAYAALCRLEDELDAAWSTRTPLGDSARSSIGQLRDRWVNETSRKMTRAVKTRSK
jgi:hypothetical protein